MDDAYREVCLMFDEAPRTTEPAEFFSMFRDFITEWQVSWSNLFDRTCSSQPINAIGYVVTTHGFP